MPLEVLRRYPSYLSNRRAYFPESAIPADESRQNYSVIPRLCYVDELRRCRKCDRDFIFFAREQHFWYEVLRFWSMPTVSSVPNAGGRITDSDSGSNGTPALSSEARSATRILPHSWMTQSPLRGGCVA